MPPPCSVQAPAVRDRSAWTCALQVLFLTMLRGFLFLFLVLSIATARAATTYYVDDQAGDDQNTGVTPTCAWKTLEKVGAQHTRLLPGDTVRFRCGGHWRGPLWSKSGEPNQPITYASYGTGDKPQILGSIALDQTNDWIRHSETIWRTRQRFESDIGILVADHGRAWGWKRWSLATLQHPFDFWYDPAEKYVYLSASQNPATQCASLELGITRHIILLTSHDVVYEGLDLRYSGGHAIGGGNTVRVTIRNCDLSWCGGGLQFIKPDGHHVRYGNGIEFWGSACGNRVENNRIWEIYDAAMTNQGDAPDANQIDLIYRNNTIWNCEYSFEFWNRPASARTENIRVESNRCYNAGKGWAHAQRPFKNGAHLMFYANTSQTTNVIIRDNLFSGTSDAIIRMDNDWRTGLMLSNNAYASGSQPLVRWQEKQAITNMADYHRLFNDSSSRRLQPQEVPSPPSP